MFEYLLVTVVLLCVINIICNYNGRARMLQKIPGPKINFILGNALVMLVSSEELMKLGRRFAREWNEIYRIWIFPLGAINIFNPEDIEIIISTTKYNDKSAVYTLLKPWLRDGLLVSNGDKWHHRRKLLTPAFHFNILRKFFVALQENSQLLVKTLQHSSGQSVDIVPVLSEFTLNSICETAMGTKLSEETTDVGKSYKAAIFDLTRLIVYRFLRVHLYPDFIFNLSAPGRRSHKYLKIIHSFTEKVVRDRREYVNKHGVELNENTLDHDDVYKRKRKTAMLDLLLLAEKDGHIDTKGIQEEVDTFMFEGHDTTASGLAFLFMELANSKHIQDKIFKELQKIFGASTRPVSTEDLPKMKYIECCIKEGLRLYPPVHFISRKLHEPVTLSGYEVPGNIFCHIQILDLHRSPKLYKNPLVFDPDRFLPENSVGRHPYAYIPFSAGPRNCIGQKFAMMEMKAVVSEVLRKFILEPVTLPQDIEFTADLVLRSSKPVYVTFLER